MPEVSINYLAVFVAAIISMIIGALWYSPIMFGNLWMRLSGLSKEDIEQAKKKGMRKSYLISFIGLLIMSYVLAHFVDYAEATSVGDGIQAGFWIWLGFIATVLVGSILWENKPVKLYLINVAHYLLVLMVMGTILSVWI